MSESKFDKRREPGGEHVLGRIRACLDGELAPEEAERVRTHCARCDACGREWSEIEGLYRTLAADAASEPPRPVWPAVRERLAERRFRLPRIPFAVGASAAVAAGLLLGLLLGSAARAPESTTESGWSEVGTLLTDAGTSLGDLYLTELSNGGETQ
ncbi:MAG: hypothetical protein ABIH26_05790 [Candidatus Eisenbacteria bacterium]